MKRQEQTQTNKKRRKNNTRHFISVNKCDQSFSAQTSTLEGNCWRKSRLESTKKPSGLVVEAEAKHILVEANSRASKRLQRCQQWRVQSKSMGKLDKEKAARSKLFMTWIAGASRDDFESLLNFECLTSHLKVYNHELKEVTSAPSDTPWPLIWMLVRYSRKHIWC